MANFQTHLATSTVLGAAYGAAGICAWNLDWGPVFLGAGLTALGGMLPDLDSDSGIPVRELFGIAAAVTPFLLYDRFRAAAFNFEQSLVLMAGLYLLIRYCIPVLLKRVTVHRGMFHSIPAMFIAGLFVYFLYHNPANPDVNVRFYLGVGAMLGFLSHLVLDEIYSVDFSGIQIKLNHFAGSALKFYTKSWKASAACYLLLTVLAALCVFENELPRLMENVPVPWESLGNFTSTVFK